MRPSRYTIGQVMLVIAVFAGLLAAPRMAVSSDRVVMVCVVGLLTALVVLNVVVETFVGKVCPACATGTAPAGPASPLLRLPGMRGTVQAVWPGSLAGRVRARRRGQVPKAGRAWHVEGVHGTARAWRDDQRPAASEQANRRAGRHGGSSDTRIGAGAQPRRGVAEKPRGAGAPEAMARLALPFQRLGSSA